MVFLSVVKPCLVFHSEGLHSSPVVMVVLLKTVCRLAYREGLADTLLFDKVKISKGNKKLPKALDKEALEKLKALCFEDLEEEMETARDIFLFACYVGAAYCDLMELSKSHLVRDDEGKMWLKFNRHKTGVPCRIK